MSIDDRLGVAVDAIVSRWKPERIILFGSAARGDCDADSDLDIVVVFDQVADEDKPRLMAAIMRTARAAGSVDVVVTDVNEYQRRRNGLSSILYWASREGKVVYQRAA